MLCLGVLVLLACSTATESRDQPSRVDSLDQVSPTLPPRPVTKVTHVIETTYYHVNGVTTTEIFKSLAANSINPKALSLGGDTFTAGLAEFESLLTYHLEAGSSCILSSATLAVNSTVTLPRHANTASLSSRQLDRWLLFAATVALHEQAHVDISLATMKEFAEVAPNGAPTCNQLESEIKNSLDRFLEIEKVRQEEFHADEIEKSNAARVPLQYQSANAKAEMARLGAEIDARTTQIIILATEITRIEQLYSIFGVPAGIYDEYKRDLNLHNALVEESKGLVISYNALVEKINRIVEELNWAP